MVTKELKVTFVSDIEEFPYNGKKFKSMTICLTDNLNDDKKDYNFDYLVVKVGDSQVDTVSGLDVGDIITDVDLRLDTQTTKQTGWQYQTCKLRSFKDILKQGGQQGAAAPAADADAKPLSPFDDPRYTKSIAELNPNLIIE